MTSRKVSAEEVIGLKKQGLTHAEIAEQTGYSVSGIQQLLAREGYVQPRRSHKEWFPWEMSKIHHKAKARQYIKELSILAQGGTLRGRPEENLWAARSRISWANDIIDRGLDYDYDPNKPPNDFSEVGGLYLREADPDDWKLDRLMSRVRREMTKNISRRKDK